MSKTAKQTKQPAQPATTWEFVFPGTGIRVPVPAGASEDEIDDAIAAHPEVIEMGKRIQARREERRRQAALAATNGTAPGEEAAAVVPQGVAP